MSKNNKGKLGMSRDDQAHKPAGRPERVPFNQGSKLAVPKGIIKKGYHAHWFIDKPGEIESAKILIGGLLESGAITDDHELQFLYDRLDRLEREDDKDKQ